MRVRVPLLRYRWFPQLWATRLTSQAADGVFQAALASAVFFNPDHATDARTAATGFVVLLLPYSVVGPFAGVFLDRWRRQRVLVVGTAVRAFLVVLAGALLGAGGPTGAPFTVAALLALSVNRFYLACLSASLPHVLPPEELVTGNALTTTSGTIATLVGGALGLAVRDLAGNGNRGDAAAAVAAAAVYLLSAAVASRLPSLLLGPVDPDRRPLAGQVLEVARQLADGARHLRRRPAALAALTTITAHRLLYGLTTFDSLLLYRNLFHDHGLLRAGLAGLGQALAASGVGVAVGAVVTPRAVRRTGTGRWVVGVLAVGGVAEVVLGAPFAQGPLLAAAFVFGVVAQSIKVCVDTVLQEHVEDEARGRVFTLYDTAYNVSFVVAAVLGAAVLPADGRSYPVLGVVAAGYLALAAGYRRSLRRHDPDRLPGGETSVRAAASARRGSPSGAAPAA